MNKTKQIKKTKNNYKKNKNQIGYKKINEIKNDDG